MKRAIVRGLVAARLLHLRIDLECDLAGIRDAVKRVAPSSSDRARAPADLQRMRAAIDQTIAEMAPSVEDAARRVA